MNAKEALKTKYVGFGDNGESLLAFTTEQVKFLESALAELEEIKKRAEEVVKMMNALNPADFGKDRPGWQPTIADYHEWLRQEINYIISGPKEGEGK